MEILRYSLGEIQANCYLLIEKDECVVIDPADEGSFLLEEIQRRNLKPLALLATHGHFDHLMAAGEIQMSFDIPFYIHEKDTFLLDRLIKTAQHFLGYKPAIIKPKNITPLPFSKFQISNFKLKIIPVPGHTPGSVCYLLKEENVLFTGDTLFKGGIGRYDFSYSDKRVLHKSLTKLFKLDESLVIYPGHGEETSLKDERK